MVEPLSALAKPLISIATAIWPRVQRRYKERRAGELPSTGQDFLEKGLDETLGRVLRGQIDDAWWQALLHRIDHALVTPEFLKSPALQKWLSARETQVDLKALARSQIVGENEDDVVLARVRQRYSESTGEDERLSNGPIDVVVAILATGYFGSVDVRTEPLIGLVQANTRTLSGLEDRLDLIAQDIAPDRHAVAAHTQTAETELEQCLKRRSLDPDRVRNDLSVLVGRTTSGDLRHATEAVKATALFWCARAHASNIDHLSTAKERLAQLRAKWPEFDTRIVEALVDATEEQIEKAARLLREIDTPDGRSALFFVLSRGRGSAAALEWFDGEPTRDSPDFLSGLGWSNVAIHLAQAGRWREGAERLAKAEAYAAEWPDLLFVEGILNVALLLPEDLRAHALRMELFHPWVRTIESEEAKQHRVQADDCFRRAADLLRDIHPARAQAAADWRLWLRLSHPDHLVSGQARAEVMEGMRYGRRAVDLVSFAQAFEIEFDDGPLRRFLAQKMRTGGLEGRELLAEFILAELKMGARERAEYLERAESTLSTVISKATITGRRIEALVADGQPARARQILVQRQSDFTELEFRSLEVLISAREGIDPRPALEALYQESGSLAHLHNLVTHLAAVKDWTSLLPRLHELFSRERTAENALRVTRCIRRSPLGSEGEIVSFTDAIGDLVEANADLASTRAWSLFFVGRWKEAKSINDRLAETRHTSADVSLDINLAIQTGDWERFAVIVDQEWQRRDQLEPSTLLRLASLAAEVDSTANRSAELAKLAAQKAPDDPKVLIAAYSLFVQLGRDGDVDSQWVTRAAALSSADGPVWQVDMRTIVEEMVPAHRDREQQVNKSLTRGEVPIAAAAHALNMPLSRLFIDIPTRTMIEYDPRRWPIIPILAGGRPPLKIGEDISLGLDTTSILLLGFLNKLSIVLKSFRRIVLAPDIMVFLLEERRRVRFHQPSLVSDAERVSALISSNKISVVLQPLSPPQWLIDEVGKDLADLLHAARSTSGSVVRPKPIPRISTFMEESANIREYQTQTVSMLDFIDDLYSQGILDKLSYDNGRKYLEGHDKSDGNSRVHIDLRKPILLDRLTLNYLHKANLLQTIGAAGIHLVIHPDVPKEMAALIEANREGERLSQRLNLLRQELRSALSDEQAVFLNRASAYDDEKLIDDLRERSLTIVDFIRNASQVDAICVDDRSLNRHSFLLDKDGRNIPVVSSIDVIRQISSLEDYHFVLHNLRRAGFALIPVDAEELEKRLLSATAHAAGRLVESAELRTLRQSLMRLRSLDMLQPDFEGIYIGALQKASILTIRKIWTNDSVEAEHAIRASDWLWENVGASPIDWVHRESSAASTVREAFGRHIGLLLEPMPTVKGERRVALVTWIEERVLTPLLPANSALVDFTATAVRASIERMVDALTASQTQADC